MGDRSYLTSQGETVDWIAWRVYGYSSGSTEAILEANRNIGLSDCQEELPSGLTLTLPTLSRPEQTKMLRLWD
jgi:phage tail protein X